MRPDLGLAPYLTANTGDSDLSTILLLFTAAITSLIPAFLQRVFFDRVIPDRNRELIAPILILLVLVESIGVYSRFCAEQQLAAVSRRKRHRMRLRLVDRIWNLKLSWHDRQGPGAVIRHFEDAGLLGNLRAIFIREIIGPAIMLLLLLPSMCLLQPLLTLSRIAAVLPALLAGSGFLNHDLRFERKIWITRKGLSTDLFSGTRAAATLKSGKGGAGFSRHLRLQMRLLGSLEERRRVLGAGWEAAATLTARFGAALTLVLAVFLVIDGRLSFGSYIAFSILSARFMSAVGELLGGIRTLARTGNAADRYKILLDQETDDGRRYVSLVKPSPGQRGLDINGLYFRYPDSGNVLHDLNMNVKKGERILLTAGSGEGKSTLFSLILGLYSPHNGKIFFSGMSLTDCAVSTRRELVGAVLQNPSFFDGTVRENLCLFAAPPSDKRLWSALEAAAADDIVSRLPGGLDARLSGENSGLSGGQRQRLAIARLMVKPPPLILLDEPVNALDSRSADQVRHSFTAACEGRTVLLISHSEDLPLPVDRRLTLVGGQIKTRGAGATID